MAGVYALGRGRGPPPPPILSRGDADMATATFGGREFQVGESCPLNPLWAIRMAEILPPAAFLKSETLQSIAGCESVRPILERAGVEFVEEEGRRGRTGAPGREEETA